VTCRPEPAVVIDRDGDCNSGDAGEIYPAGEVFADLQNGKSVSIDLTIETGL
jgi:hypothetical protein